MNPLFYVARFIYHLRYWFLILPIIVALLVTFFTRHQSLVYSVESSIYTGVISGENTIMDDPESSMTSVQNAKIENMITLINSASTLKMVSIRLFATNVLYGDPKKDNTYIKSMAYNELIESIPDEVKKLIDKSSLEKTVDNLTKYSEKDPDNFLYSLFNFNHPHYSYAALSKVAVKRIGFSDILKITYSTNDPGVAYNTLKILNQVFVKQYDDLRFTGTNDVINFFQEELKRVEVDLEKSEDDLTNYNVANKIINYGEQTKQISAMNRDFILQYEDNSLKYHGSKALVESLEKRIGSNVKQLKTNNDFLFKLQRISNLTSLLTAMKSFGQDSVPNKQSQVNMYTKQLEEAEADFKNFTDSYYSEKYSKEGYSNEDIIQEWLAELLKLQEYAAQKEVLDNWKKELDKDFLYYSPIGAIIKRKERKIDFTEASYLAVLKGLHDSMLRQKSLEMTAATLKVVNPPSFPLTAMPTKRKTTIMAAYVGTILFIIFFFIIVDFLDQTLRDRLRTERITGCKVIGGFPSYSLLKHKEFEEEQKHIAISQLANALLNYFKPKSPQIINVISFKPEEGKSEIVKYLSAYWQSKGMNVKTVDWKTDFETKKRELILSKSITELTEVKDEDIIIVEYPPLKEQTMSHFLLSESTFNLLIVRADRTWKETDRIALNYLNEGCKEVPLMIELNNARLSVVEEFTGLLPPYPKLRKFGYRILHLGLTSKDKIS